MSLDKCLGATVRVGTRVLLLYLLRILSMFLSRFVFRLLDPLRFLDLRSKEAREHALHETPDRISQFDFRRVDSLIAAAETGHALNGRERSPKCNRVCLIP